MTIILYTTPQCPMCKQVKKFLDDLRIQYEERNAQVYANYLLSKGFMSVPLVEIDGVIYRVQSLNTLILILQSHNLY
ncbi:MAG: NrdH-redoxin [Chloroflexi bacterium]|nr:MAG: NrdH-redoxin [Chloroflexota bacterium]